MGAFAPREPQLWQRDDACAVFHPGFGHGHRHLTAWRRTMDSHAGRKTVHLLWELETFLQQRGLLSPSTTLLLNNNGTLCTWRLIMTSTTLLCGRGSQITPQAQMPI